MERTSASRRGCQLSGLIPAGHWPWGLPEAGGGRGNRLTLRFKMPSTKKINLHSAWNERKATQLIRSRKWMKKTHSQIQLRWRGWKKGAGRGRGALKRERGLKRKRERVSGRWGRMERALRQMLIMKSIFNQSLQHEYIKRRQSEQNKREREKGREREMERERRGERSKEWEKERERKADSAGYRLRRVSPSGSLYFRASQTGLTAFPFGSFCCALFCLKYERGGWQRGRASKACCGTFALFGH